MNRTYDVVIVGGTPGGIACAIRAARQGLAVLLVNYTRHLGGMFSSGLGVTDTLYDGYRSPIYEEFVQRVKDHYAAVYGADSEQYAACFHRRRLHFEAHVAENILTGMVSAEAGIDVLSGYYPVSVSRAENKLLGLTAASFDAGPSVTVAADVFIDSTYEGDLAAAAGVPYRVGRESRREFGEQHAGRIFSSHGRGRYPLEAEQGLLNTATFPVISQEIFAGSTGEGDGATQAYNFRMCLTCDPANRKLPEKPEGYDRSRYLGIVESPAESLGKPYMLKSQLLLGDVRQWGIGSTIPNKKSSWNDPTLPGGNHEYPTADWAKRKEIIRAHRDHALGILYFLQNDEAVPEPVREKAKNWGLALDEFADNDHIPYEMYVREARRIVGRHVFTEHDGTLAPGLERTPIHEDSIAIAEWPMDSHECTTDRRAGSLNEGKFLLSESTRPSQIPYRCLLPLGVDNLLVPVCLSSTHVGWGTLRLEPVWMQVGEVAGFASALAIGQNVMPADLAADELQRVLVESGIMISFFNEFDMMEENDWVPAIQYLGTKGFFASYNAKPEEPLDEATAKLWVRTACDMWRGENNPGTSARKLPAHPGDDAGTVSAAQFRALLERELSFRDVRREIPTDTGRTEGGMTRGEACTMLYSMLRNASEGWKR